MAASELNIKSRVVLTIEVNVNDALSSATPIQAIVDHAERLAELSVLSALRPKFSEARILKTSVGPISTSPVEAPRRNDNAYRCLNCLDTGFVAGDPDQKCGCQAGSMA